MNIVRIPRLLKNSAFLLSVLGSSLLLSACGGDSNKSDNSSSLSSSSTSSHTFIPTPFKPALSGTWPDVKVSASGTKTLKFDWSDVPGATFYKLLKKADRDSAFVQVGTDFNGISVSLPISIHLTDWVNSKYLVQACNNTGCQDSTVIVADSAMNTAITYMKASNTDANDWFGWSIAISGDGKTMAVGAPAESGNAKDVNGVETSNAISTSPSSGAVYVFAKINGNWQQEAYLKASNTEQPSDGITLPLPNFNSRFGYQVALSTDGNTLAVSAINEDSVSVGVNCAPHNVSFSSNAANSQGYVIRNQDFDIGAVYVFKRSSAQWSQSAYIKPLIPDKNLMFGYSLALAGDGKTLAVGTAVEGTYVSGLVYVEENSSSSTAFVCANFSSNSSTINSSLSSSKSSSSSSATNSANSSSIPGGPNSGAAYIYRLKDSGWTEEAYVKASDAGQDDYFGASITLSQDGNLMAVGAPGEDSKTPNANNDTVTINGTDYLLNNGGVYIFARSANKWAEQAKLKPSFIQLNQSFGASVALSADGTTLAVGTPDDWTKAGGINGNTVYDPKDDSYYGSGAAYIFTKSGATWSQQAYIKPNIVKPLYQFGSIVSLSANGNVFAVGSWIESSLATGINGDELDMSSSNSGAAYVFTRTGTTWAQKSYIKAPINKAFNRFGRAIKLDDSGESLAVGAYREASKAIGINGDKEDNSAGINGDKEHNSAPGAGAAYIY